MKYKGYQIKEHRAGVRGGYEAMAYKAYAPTIETGRYFGTGAKRKAREAAMAQIDQLLAEKGDSCNKPGCDRRDKETGKCTAIHCLWDETVRAWIL